MLGERDEKGKPKHKLTKLLAIKPPQRDKEQTVALFEDRGVKVTHVPPRDLPLQ